MNNLVLFGVHLQFSQLKIKLFEDKSQICLEVFNNDENKIIIRIFTKNKSYFQIISMKNGHILNEIKSQIFITFYQIIKKLNNKEIKEFIYKLLNHLYENHFYIKIIKLLILHFKLQLIIINHHLFDENEMDIIKIIELFNNDIISLKLVLFRTFYLIFHVKFYYYFLFKNELLFDQLLTFLPNHKQYLPFIIKSLNNKNIIFDLSKKCLIIVLSFLKTNDKINVSKTCLYLFNIMNEFQNMFEENCKCLYMANNFKSLGILKSLLFINHSLDMLNSKQSCINLIINLLNINNLKGYIHNKLFIKVILYYFTNNLNDNLLVLDTIKIYKLKQFCKLEEFLKKKTYSVKIIKNTIKNTLFFMFSNDKYNYDILISIIEKLLKEIGLLNVILNYQNNNNNYYKLSKDVHLKINQYLNVQELCKISKTSLYFYSICINYKSILSINYNDILYTTNIGFPMNCKFIKEIECELFEELSHYYHLLPNIKFLKIDKLSCGKQVNKLFLSKLEKLRINVISQDFGIFHFFLKLKQLESITIRKFKSPYKQCSSIELNKSELSKLKLISQNLKYLKNITMLDFPKTILQCAIVRILIPDYKLNSLTLTLPSLVYNKTWKFMLHRLRKYSINYVIFDCYKNFITFMKLMQYQKKEKFQMLHLKLHGVYNIRFETFLKFLKFLLHNECETLIIETKESIHFSNNKYKKV